MEVPSLRPELGVELFRLVLLRESYIKRLLQQLKGLKGGRIDLSIIGLIDLLRETSLEVVEILEEWEQSQVNYPDTVVPFTWNRINYLEKMRSDLNFLSEYPAITEWLGFDVIDNPFIIPTDFFPSKTKTATTVQGMSLVDMGFTKQSFVIFGSKPEINPSDQQVKVKKKLKSPYFAPIINDPEVYASLSAKSKLDKQFKPAVPTTASVSKEGQAKELESLYQCYLSHEAVMRIHKSMLKIFPEPTYSSMTENKWSFEESTGLLDSKLQPPTFDRSFELPEDHLEPKESLSEVAPHSSVSSFDGQKSNDFSDPVDYLQLQHSNDASNSFTFQQSSLRQVKDRPTMIPALTHPTTFNTNLESFYQQHQQSTLTSTGKLSTTQIWAPQDIHFQRQIERRGGELFVLTVAGTKGRMLPPRRRTRFERLVNDLEHLSQLSDQFGMIIEDLLSELLRLSESSPDTRLFLESLSGKVTGTTNPIIRAYLLELQMKIDAHQDVLNRLQFTKNLYHHYQLVSENGRITSLESERQRHQLGDGQTRESDQYLSMQLEDKMIKKIQVIVRRAFGRALRRAEWARRHKAAIRIQCAYRMSRVNRSIRRRIQQLRLALMVQRLYRMKVAGALRRQLQLEALQRSSAKLIQRVYRGARGRRRLQLKRTFVRSIQAAKQAVSLLELKPADIECIADAVEDYVRDYTVSLPLHVLTILRGILYLFNGENSECILICNDEGYQEKRYIHAAVASWSSMKLILRRKGRFLRRLRALIQNTCLPNPSRIVMNEDCRIHLQAIATQLSITEIITAVEEKCRHGIQQLYHYLYSIYQAYCLQDLFPEYFEPGLPSWFRSLMKLREAYDRAEFTKRMEQQTLKRINDIKKIHGKEGKKYKHISNAVRTNQKEVEEAKQTYSTSKKKYVTMMKELLASEERQLLTLEAIVQAKTLARNVSEGDLKEYMRATLIPDEQHIKSLQFTLDAKTIGLIQSKTDLIVYGEIVQRNRSFRDFDKLLTFQSILDDCIILGRVKGDLLILLESWQALIHEIGGVQYLKDLVGEKRDRFEVIESKAYLLLDQRRELIERMESTLQEQYSRIYQFIYAVNQSQIGKKWDKPTPVEIEYEDQENRECCKRDYELEFRKRRQLEIITLTPAYDWIPMLIILDAKLPYDYLFQFQESIKYRYHFQVFSLEDIVFSMTMDETFTPTTTMTSTTTSTTTPGRLQYNHIPLHQELQTAIHQQQNILLIAQRGFHYQSSLLFDHYINALVNVLIPRPRIAMITAENCFQANPLVDKLQNPNVVVESPFLQTTADKSLRKKRQQENRVKVQRQQQQLQAANRITPIVPVTESLTKELLVSFDVICGKFRKISEYLRCLLLLLTTTASTASVPSPGINPSTKSLSTKIMMTSGSISSDHPIDSIDPSLLKLFPPLLLQQFQFDFQDFLQSLKLTVRRAHTFHNEDNHRVMKDLLLAMNLAVTWRLHKAPYRAWTLTDLKAGALQLRILLSKIDLLELCQYFSMRSFCVNGNQNDKNQSVHTKEENTGNTPFQFSMNAYLYEEAPEVHQQLVDQEQHYLSVWDGLSHIDFYQQPFRYLLVGYITAMRELIQWTSTRLIRPPVTPTYHFYWHPSKEQVEGFIHYQVLREIHLANIWNRLLQERKVFEKLAPIWKFYYNRENMESMTQQSLGAVAVGKHLLTAAPTNLDGEGGGEGGGGATVTSSSSFVTVYHNGNELYVELALNTSHEMYLQSFPEPKSRQAMIKLGLYPEISSDSNPPNRAEEKQQQEIHSICRFFTKLHADDFVTLIQPNYTEIFEGNVKKSIVAASSNRQDYYQAIAKWVCLDCIGGQLDLSVIRARYLILSKLGSIGGYYVRLEVYEERFGEIQVLVFGLDQAVENMQRANQRKMLKKLQQLQAVTAGGGSNNPGGGGGGRQSIVSPTGRTSMIATSTTLGADSRAIAAAEANQLSVGGSVIYQLKIRKPEINRLAVFCDEELEKDKLEALDSGALSYVFTDRLQITPSTNWFFFLHSGELIPRVIPKPLQLTTRVRHGPGRLVGSKLLNLRKLYFQNHTNKFTNDRGRLLILVTIYEVSSARNLHELRVVLYHLYSGQSVEYRLSAMERMMLFKDFPSLLEQIIDRIKVVYCNLQNYDQRVYLELLELQEKTPGKPNMRVNIEEDLLIKEYEVEGDTEYQILTKIGDSDEEAEDDEEEESEEGSDDHSNEENESQTSKESSSTNLSRRNKAGKKKKKRHPTTGTGGGRLANSRFQSFATKASLSSSSASAASSALELARARFKGEQVEDTDNDWGFVVCFDRTCLQELYGNLQVSVVFDVHRRGFLYLVTDPRTCYQSTRFLGFPQMGPVLGKTLEQIEEDLSNLDESVAYDMIDDCLQAVELEDHPDEGLILYLQKDVAFLAENLEMAQQERQTLLSDAIIDPLMIKEGTGTDDEVYVIARLKELPPIDEMSPENRVISSKGKRREAPISYRVTLEIVKLTELARLGAFGGRNPYCLVRFNMREIGRTGIVRNTTNPVFTTSQNNTFTIHVSKESMLATSAIEIEVYDTDARGKTTDYLGHVKLQGENLFLLLDEDSRRKPATGSGNSNNPSNQLPPGVMSFELQKSKRISDGENKYVKGMIYLKGSKTVLNAKNANTVTTTIRSGINEELHRVSDISTPGIEVLVDSSHPIASEVKSFGLFLPYLTITKTLMETYFEKRNPPKSLAGVLSSAASIAAAKSFLLVLYLNQQEIYRCRLPFHPTKAFVAAPFHPGNVSEVYYYPLDPVIPIECRLPDRFPVSLMEVQVALFFCMPRSRPELVGKTRIAGAHLRDLLRDALTSTSITPSIAKLREATISMVSEDYYHSSNIYHTSHAPTPLGSLAFYPTLWKPSSLHYKLIIRSGRNLPKADLFGKSDPFVKVFFNGHALGETEYVLNTINPNWIGKQEEFDLYLPPHLPIHENILELQIYDYDKFSESDLLGIRIITGSIFQQFISIANVTTSTENQEQVKKWKEWNKADKTIRTEYNSSNKSVFFALETAPAPLSQSVVVRGDIEVAVVRVSEGIPVHSMYPSMQPEEEPVSTKETTTIDRKKDISQLSISYSEHCYQQFSKELLSRNYLALEHSLLPKQSTASLYRLYIISAKGLANADLLGKSDPFVQVWFNGLKVGMTKVISDTLNPIWNEYFDLPIATGQSFETCYLQLEVYDEDNHQQSEFLGSLYLEGEQLIELMAETKINRDLKRDQYSFLPFYELQRLTNTATATILTEKENKYVKGSIQIGLERLLPDQQPPTTTLNAIRSPPSTANATNTGNTLHQDYQKLSSDYPPLDPLQESTSISTEIDLEEPRSIHDRSTIRIELCPKVTHLTTLIPSADLSQWTTPPRNNTVFLWILLNQELWYSIPGKIQLVPFQSNRLEIRWIFPAAKMKSLSSPSGVSLQFAEQTRMEENYLEFRIVKECISDEEAATMTTRPRDTEGEVSLDHPSIIHYLRPSSMKVLMSAIYTGKTLINLLELTEEQYLSRAMEPPTTSGSRRGEEESLAGGSDRLLRTLPLTNQAITSPHRLEESLVSFATSNYLLCLCQKREIPQSSQYSLTTIKKLHVPYAIEQIESTLPETETSWTHYFTHERIFFHFETKIEEKKETKDEIESKLMIPDRKTTALLVMRRGRHASTVPPDRSSVLLTSHPLPVVGETLAGTEATTVPEGEEKKELSQHPSTTTMPTRDKQEHSAMDFTLTVQSKQEEENRVYWRGKLLPKHAVFTSEKAKQTILASRSSRLMRNHSINDMEIMADVHYLVDFGDETIIANDDLPICVREVVSQGPGLIQRTFRMELLTNTGILLGTAELADDREDLLLCIGKDCPFYPQLVETDWRTWNLQEIFEYIAKERLIFDMMTTGGDEEEEEEGEGGGAGASQKRNKEMERREGIIAQHAENADVTAGSVISILRGDQKPAEAKKKAKRKGKSRKKEKDNHTATNGKKNRFGGFFSSLRRPKLPTLLEKEKEETAAEEEDHEEDRDEETNTERDHSSTIKHSNSVNTNTSGAPTTARDPKEGPREEKEGEENLIATTSEEKQLEEEKVSSANDLTTEQKQELLQLLTSSLPSELMRGLAMIDHPSENSRILTTYKKSWIRMYTRSQRITGKTFRCIIFIAGIHELFLTCYKLPSGLDRYFRQYPQEGTFEGLFPLLFFLYAVDPLTKKAYEMIIPGRLISQWLRNEFPYPNIDTKFRRQKLGAFLCAFLSLTYLPNQDFVIHLLRDANAMYPRDNDDNDNQEEEEEELVEGEEENREGDRDKKSNEKGDAEDDEEEEDDEDWQEEEGEGKHSLTGKKRHVERRRSSSHKLRSRSASISGESLVSRGEGDLPSLSSSKPSTRRSSRVVNATEL